MEEQTGWQWVKVMELKSDKNSSKLVASNSMIPPYNVQVSELIHNTTDLEINTPNVC